MKYKVLIPTIIVSFALLAVIFMLLSKGKEENNNNVLLNENINTQDGISNSNKKVKDLANGLVNIKEEGTKSENGTKEKEEKEEKQGYDTSSNKGTEDTSEIKISENKETNLVANSTKESIDIFDGELGSIANSKAYKILGDSSILIDYKSVAFSQEGTMLELNSLSEYDKAQALGAVSVACAQYNYLAESQQAGVFDKPTLKQLNSIYFLQEDSSAMPKEREFLDIYPLSADLSVSSEGARVRVVMSDDETYIIYLEISDGRVTKYEILGVE